MNFTIDNIENAINRIEEEIIKTPLIRLENLDKYLGFQVYLKLENLQKTGSFKYRGAMNKIKSLKPEEMSNGIVCASSGNHGRAISFAAKELGIPAIVVIPHTTPKIKVDAIKNLGAEVVSCESSERFIISEKISKEKNMVEVHPFDDIEVMAGQGTIGLEILDQCPDLDYVIVPVSGGGLIGGISTAIKGKNNKIKVIGAEPKNAPAYSVALKEGKVTEAKSEKTIADALPASKAGLVNFPVVRKNVDKIIAVSEENIIRASKLLIFEGKILAEFSSSIGIGALLQGDLNIEKSSKVCFVISGGSIGIDQLSILNEQ